jgi:acetyltransferase-like isoleucine patch superfamily enzyme
VWIALKRENISHGGQATMAKFMGTGQVKDKQRFEHWQYPEVVDGKLTKHHWIVQHVAGFKLGYKTDIGAFTYINAQFGVVIEDKVQIGSHCSLYSVSTIDNKEGEIILKKKSRIGSHSTIMPGVTVGENAIVGAHSFVISDIPANCLAVGVPAKIIKKSII